MKQRTKRAGIAVLSDGVQKTLPGLILAWFDRVQRDMPWRKTRDPYAIWVSETMLQQTQVETVKPFYTKFLRRFPTVGDLAQAELSEVLKEWAGLGYYRRAKFLHRAAGVVVEKFGGKVPGEVAQLLELPGVGRYTAGAVASLAFGVRAAAVDGNVLRVLARVAGAEVDIKNAQVQKELWVMAEGLVREGGDRPGDFNQGMMELGATVCRPRDPGCLECPIGKLCFANLTKKVAKIPKISKGADKIGVKKDVYLLFWGDLGLILQRPGGGLWEHLWEFPVLDTEHCDTLKEREAVIGRELGLEVVLEDWVGKVEHVLTHRRMEYSVYRGAVVGWVGGTKSTAKRPSEGGGVGVEGVLPTCGEGRYEAAAWVKLGELGKLHAVGRVTEKIGLMAKVTSDQ